MRKTIVAILLVWSVLATAVAFLIFSYFFGLSIKK